VTRWWDEVEESSNEAGSGDRSRESRRRVAADGRKTQTEVQCQQSAASSEEFELAIAGFDAW